MKDEINKNELNDSELDEVSGGWNESKFGKYNNCEANCKFQLRRRVRFNHNGQTGVGTIIWNSGREPLIKYKIKCDDGTCFECTEDDIEKYE